MDTRVSALIAGKPHGLQFDSVKIKQGLFEHCTIELELSFDMYKSAQIIEDAASNWLGEKLEVTISDRIDFTIEKNYIGYITNINSTVNNLTISAVSEDILLSAGNKYKSYNDKDVISIVKEMVLSVNIDDKEVKSPENSTKLEFFQQYNENDFDTLKRLAKMDGCVFYHDGENFVYSEKTGVKGSIMLGLEEVEDVNINMKLDRTKWKGMPYNYKKHTEPNDSEYLSSTIQLPEHPFTSKSYDKSKKLFEPVTDELYNHIINSKQDYEKYLQKEQEYSVGDLVNVTGKTSNPNVAVGRTISSPLHPILKDAVVVTSMTAVFQDNMYDATFEAKAVEAKTEPEISEEPQMQNDIAKVIDNVDPEKLGRVQIQYLWDNDGQSHAWARVVQAGAGMTDNGVSYGTHYTPRIGDQVFVTCENGDPSQPMIVGGLYHSEHKPDMETDNGAEEVLVAKTPRESTIRVLDKHGHEEVIISMKDKKNIIRLELKQPKITVESVNGTIHVHANHITVHADQKLELKSEMIEVTADKNMTVTVGKDYNESISNDYNSTVGNNSSIIVSKDMKIETTQKFGIVCNDELEMKAMTKIKQIAGTEISLESVQIGSKASGINTIQGAMVKIN